MDSVYKIKKNLKVPMVLATVLSIPVFADVLMRGFELSMLILAVILMILFYLLTINNILRKVHITDTEIIMRSIGGLRRIPVQDITLIDGVTMGSKQFLSISGNKKHYLIPNSFDNFPEMLSDIQKVAREETLGKGFEGLKENYVPRKSDIAGAWITVLVLVIILFIRFFPK
ncbi:MAG TPA: hypothetical protein PKM41_10640 [Deltaproteobacteria bacterium]|jgi:hypothetical protein|nr:hypothetical protein [Deltaproteobacteria bacterium]HOI06391.1 hypothetical protein [Deltaproteobacteria bacterium]